MSDDDVVDVCGESYDHTLALISSTGGIRTFECRECGERFTEEGPDMEVPLYRAAEPGEADRG